MILFKTNDGILIRKPPEHAKEHALDFINKYFPELLPDIEAYATANNTDSGTIAAITITAIISPTLQLSRHSDKGETK